MQGRISHLRRNTQQLVLMNDDICRPPERNDLQFSASAARGLPRRTTPTPVEVDTVFKIRASPSRRICETQADC